MIDDDSLILYYYEDGLEDAQRRRIAAALADDAELASRYRDLCHDLDALEDATPPSAPADSMVRWHYALDRAIEASTPRSDGTVAWRWLVAAAAVLVLGIALGTRLDFHSTTQPTLATDPLPLPASTPGAQPAAVPVALTRGLRAYMHQSRGRLEGLARADTRKRADLIDDLVAQNRAFERAASASGADDLARVLRAFEQVLNKLGSTDLPATEVEAGTDQLSFELAVMLTKLSQDPSDPQYSL